MGPLGSFLERRDGKVKAALARLTAFLAAVAPKGPDPRGAPSLSSPAPTSCVRDIDRCAFLGAGDVLTYEVALARGSAKRLANVSAGTPRFFLRLDADEDADLQVRYASGGMLLDYASSTNFGERLIRVNDTNADFYACVDSCEDAFDAGPYRDGSVYGVVGKPDMASEWIYVEAAAEDLVVSAVSYGGGRALVSVLYDCPEDCCECRVWTAPPSPAPTARPTTAYPTRAATPNRTAQPTPVSFQPSAAPTFEPPTPAPSTWPTERLGHDDGDDPVCVYTPEPVVFETSLQPPAARGRPSSTRIVLPRSARKVFVRVNASSLDVDLHLETWDGTVLVSYEENVNWDQNAASQGEHDGVGKIIACVDGCRENVTVGPYDGKTFTMYGDASYSNEYVYVEDSLTELSLVVQSYDANGGNATLTVLYDCPASCCECAAVENPLGEYWPTRAPTTAKPSTAPTAPTAGPWELHTIDDEGLGADGTRLADANGDGWPEIAAGWEESGDVRGPRVSPSFLYRGTRR